MRSFSSAAAAAATESTGSLTSTGSSGDALISTGATGASAFGGKLFRDESDGEAKPEPKEPAGEQLPGGWVKGWDPQRERVYYWHAASSTSSWSLPAAAPSADADGVVAGLLSVYASSGSSSDSEG